MGYNISTMFIWQYFKEDNYCPVCKLKIKTETDLLTQYLNEAVMEEDERGLVNKLGFCEKHFDLLFEGKNKLGLALQNLTRIDYLKSHLVKPLKSKEIKKYSEKSNITICSCIICKKIQDNMDRYLETIPKMFLHEDKFEDTLNNTSGFCIPHYLSLVENANYAGKRCDEFLNIIYLKEQKYLDELTDNLNQFTKAFDYHNSSPLSKEASLSLKECRLKLYGEKSKTPQD